MSRSTPSPPRLTTLILLSGLSVVSLNMFLPSLPNIAAEFETNYALANLSVAGYAAVTAVLQLILPPLSDRFGRRPVILAALAVFLTGSLGCLLATDITTFLAFRTLQAAIVSGSTVSLAIVRDTTKAEKAASLMGYLAMAWAVAPMLGPMAGGMLDEFFGWRASFIAFLAMGASVFLLCWFDLGETNRTPSRTIATQFRTYPELLRSPRLWGYALCAAFSTSAFYAFISGAPLAAKTTFGISTGELGLFMGTITAGFMFGSFLSGRLTGRYRPTTMILAGRIVASTGLSVGIILLLADAINVYLYFAACACVGTGNGLTTPGSYAGAMSVRPELSGSTAGLMGSLTVTTGAVVAAVTGTVLSEQTAAAGLLVIMLFSSVVGLAAAVFVRRTEN